MLQRDSVAGTFLVAGVLCVVCSLLVSSAAVGFKKQQDLNKELDRKKNVLIAAGLCDKSAKASDVSTLFEKNINELLVDLSTGKVLSEEETPDNYDSEKASKDPGQQIGVEPPDALMGVRYRAPYESVYQILEEEQVSGYIFPVQGKGLWSTLKGFLALEADGQTVRGITFYSHAETPGLGGEVDNEGWKASWQGKQIYDDSGAVALDVVKGVATSDYQIDGLSGATITSKGVDRMVDYWLGENGYGPFLKNQKKPAVQAATTQHPTGTQLATQRR